MVYYEQNFGRGQARGTKQLMRKGGRARGHVHLPKNGCDPGDPVKSAHINSTCRSGMLGERAWRGSRE